MVSASENICKDGKLKYDRRHIETWDSWKTPDQQQESKSDHYKNNRVHRNQSKRNAVANNQSLLEREARQKK